MQKNLYIKIEEDNKMKIKLTIKEYNKLIKELKEMREVMKANKASAEAAAEKAGRLDNDDQVERCSFRAATISPQLQKVENLIDEYDKY